MTTKTQMKVDRVYLDRLKEVGTRNITRVLDALGVEYSEFSSYYKGCCPIHDHPGDGNNSSAFNWCDRYWRCYTHNCQEKYGADIYGLVMGILDCSFGDAISFVEEHIDKSDWDTTPEARPHKMNLVPKFHAPINETCLQFLVPNHPFIVKRNFDGDVIAKYNVGYWKRLGTFMHDRIVVPIRDHNDILVGFSGRTVRDESDWSKFNIESKWIHGRFFDRWPSKNDRLSVSSLLFNLSNAKKFIGPDKEIILVEGPFDGFRLEEAGIHNWVAALSCSFGHLHRSLLVRYGINKLRVAFDSDPAGQRGCEVVQSIIDGMFEVEKILLPAGKDPDKLSIQEISEIF